MTDPKLGTIITGDLPPLRDAIHIAITPVTAGEMLRPGEPLEFVSGSMDTVQAASHAAIGIVDPFIKTRVRAGQKFWMLLYPGTITSLRHEWTHPALDGQSQGANMDPNTPPSIREGASASFKRLVEIADMAEISYSELMEGANNYLERDDYMIDGGKWSGFSIPDDFWDHYTAVTGTVVLPRNRGNFFSCSC